MFWYDGQLYESEVDDVAGFDTAAVRFGASVFTTLRVYDGSLDHPMTQWQGHCDRLTQSLTHFKWPIPHWPAVHEGCQVLKAHYPVLRITVFSDGKAWVTGRELPADLANHQQKGITAWLAPADYTRSFPEHKTGNYLACWLARQAAQRQGADEAILTNAQGDWLETATGNLWGWVNGQWWTPAGTSLGNQCLPGLMRQRILYLLAEMGHTVNLAPWPQLTWSQFDAIAYSNCVVQLLPIHTILFEHTTLEYDSQHASLKALQQLIIRSTEHAGDS
ncbi:MAG: aminotransferase class IV [Cyanobacteria bacterium J06632_3]